MPFEHGNLFLMVGGVKQDSKQEQTEHFTSRINWGWCQLLETTLVIETQTLQKGESDALQKLSDQGTLSYSFFLTTSLY